jgi:hypothetical protein
MYVLVTVSPGEPQAVGVTSLGLFVTLGSRNWKDSCPPCCICTLGTHPQEIIQSHLKTLVGQSFTTAAFICFGAVGWICSFSVCTEKLVSAAQCFFFFKSTSVSYNLCTICIILNKWSYEFSQMYMWAVHWQNQSHNQDEKLSHYLPTFPMGPFAIHPSAPDSFMSAFHGYKLVLPVLELQINRIIQCGLFWVWLLLVRMSRDSSTLLGSAPDQDSSVCFWEKGNAVNSHIWSEGTN